MARYGALFKEFRVSDQKAPYLFYLVFIIRRLNLVISFHMIKNYSLAQVISCSLACWVVVAYLTLTRPYADNKTNLVQLSVEICVAIVYTAAGILLQDDVDENIIAWIIFIGVNLSYALQIFPIFHNAINKLFAKFKSRRNSTKIEANPAINNEKTIKSPSDINISFQDDSVIKKNQP